MGFSGTALFGCVAFDTILALTLYLAARKPRLPRLVVILLATAMAALALAHRSAVGAAEADLSGAQRLVAMTGPVLGALGLAWA